MPPRARPCPSGCGFATTRHPTHCCGLCSREPGTHASSCERQACADPATERAAALVELGEQAASFRSAADLSTAQIQKLRGPVDQCKQAHGHFLRSMQLLRAAEHLGDAPPSAASRGTGEGSAAEASPRQAKTAEALKEVEELGFDLLDSPSYLPTHLPMLPTYHCSPTHPPLVI